MSSRLSEKMRTLYPPILEKNMCSLLSAIHISSDIFQIHVSRCRSLVAGVL